MYDLFRYLFLLRYYVRLPGCDTCCCTEATSTMTRWRREMVRAKRKTSELEPVGTTGESFQKIIRERENSVQNYSVNGKPPALLILGHGSRDTHGEEEFHELVSLVRKRSPSPLVEGGFIELSRPPISECVDRLVEDGARDISAVPLMLLAAGHAKNDIPATLVREGTNHPEVRFRYGRALGVRPELLGLMDKRISSVVPEEEKGDTAVLIVGRGSSDPDANSDLYKISRLLYEGRPYPIVETAFVSLASPKVPEALDRLRRLGARRVVVFSYFLFTGVLEERIREQSEAFADANLDLEVRYAGYFGPTEEVADLVLARHREAVSGDIRMNCDVCVHRVALPGFEEKVGAPATPHHHPDEPGHHSHGHHH